MVSRFSNLLIRDCKIFLRIFGFTLYKIDIFRYNITLWIKSKSRSEDSYDRARTKYVWQYGLQ